MNADTKKTPKKPIDWERIELDYRSGQKTLREIASQHDITHGAINKRAKKDGWTRDLAAKIREKAKQLVSKDLVSKEVSSHSLVTERDVVEANARETAAVLIGHRKDIGRGRALAMRLMEELELVTDNKELIAEVGVLMTLPDPDAPKDESKRLERLQQLFDAVISTPGRIDSIKKLSETMKNLIALEREAFALNDDSTPEGDRKLTDDQVTSRINELLSKARKIDT